MSVLQIFISDIHLKTSISTKSVDSLKLLVVYEEDLCEYGIHSKAKIDPTVFRFHQTIYLPLKNAQLNAYIHRLKFLLYMTRGDKSVCVGQCTVPASCLDTKISRSLDLYNKRGDITALVMVSFFFNSPTLDLGDNVQIKGSKGDKSKEYSFLLSRKLRRASADLPVSFDSKVNAHVEKDTKKYTQNMPSRPPSRPPSAPRARPLSAPRGGSPKTRPTCMSVGYVKNAWPDPNDYETEKQLFKLRLAAERKGELLKEIGETLRGPKGSRGGGSSRPSSRPSFRPKSRPRSEIDSRILSVAVKRGEEELKELRRTWAELKGAKAGGLEKEEKGIFSAPVSPLRASRGLAEKLLKSYEEKLGEKGARPEGSGTGGERREEKKRVVKNKGTEAKALVTAQQQKKEKPMPGFLKPPTSRPRVPPSKPSLPPKQKAPPKKEKKREKPLPSHQKGDWNGDWGEKLVGKSDGQDDERGYLDLESDEGEDSPHNALPLSSTSTSLLVDDLASDLDRQIASILSSQEEEQGTGLYPERLLTQTIRYHYTIGDGPPKGALVSSKEKIATQFEKNRKYEREGDRSSDEDTVERLVEGARGKKKEEWGEEEEHRKVSKEKEKASTLPSVLPSSPPALSSAAPLSSTGGTLHRDRKRGGREGIRRQFEKNRNYQQKKTEKEAEQEENRKILQSVGTGESKEERKEERKVVESNGGESAGEKFDMLAGVSSDEEREAFLRFMGEGALSSSEESDKN